MVPLTIVKLPLGGNADQVPVAVLGWRDGVEDELNHSGIPFALEPPRRITLRHNRLKSRVELTHLDPGGYRHAIAEVELRCLAAVDERRLAIKAQRATNPSLLRRPLCPADQIA